MLRPLVSGSAPATPHIPQKTRTAVQRWMSGLLCAFTKHSAHVNLSLKQTTPTEDKVACQSVNAVQKCDFLLGLWPGDKVKAMNGPAPGWRLLCTTTLHLTLHQAPVALSKGSFVSVLGPSCQASV